MLFRADEGRDKFQRLWCKPALELYTGLFCSVLISWCQAANWDLSDFLALSDYWTAWEPGKKYGSQCWTIDKSYWYVSAYIIGVLTSSGPAPSRVDMNYILKNVTKWICSPTRLSPSWLVSLLNCSVTLVIYLLCMKYYTRSNCWLQTNYQANVYEKQIQKTEHCSWFLTCLNICETLFLIIFPVLVDI